MEDFALPVDNSTDFIGRVFARTSEHDVSVANLLTPAKLVQTDPGQATQTVQAELYAQEFKNGMALIEPYGFTSAPLPGATALGAFIGGRREDGIALLPHDPRYRPTNLQPGEVCLYNRADAEGSACRIHLMADGSIEIAVPDGTATLSADVNPADLIPAEEREGA